MEEKRMVILRIRRDDAVQTLGHGMVFDGLEKIFDFKTMELPWLDNKQNVSCIKDGSYWVEKFLSPSKGNCFLLKNVEGRSMVEMHVANFFSDLLGCIGPGEKFTDINEDGYLDVKSSQKTLNKLLEMMPSRFRLTIAWCD